MKNTDFRYILNGDEIPTEYYSDQPYIIQADDGAWVCVVTTGPGIEGQCGQHIICTRSTDLGKTWSAPIALEPPGGPEASYSVLLKIEKRIYCFYNHNTDNLREVLADPAFFPSGTWDRVDSQGHFVYKYSDDNGLTWSKDRFEIPIRLTDIDRKNPYGGKVRFGWNVGKALYHEGAAFVPFHKIGKFGNTGYAISEGVLLKCANINDKNCSKHIWETLPDGEYGLQTPPGGGPISEEQSVSILSDGSFYCVYRSVDGFPVYSYSRDGGHSWDPPQYKRYANGRLFRHNRAANFCWKCNNGKYLYWYNNHGGTDYIGRNPVWISGGIEADSPNGKIIHWTQGEIILFDDDPNIGMSYPDLIEEEGRYFISETQKDYARVHEIPASFFEILWSQFDRKEICKDALIAGQADKDMGLNKFKMPQLQAFLIQDPDASDRRTMDKYRGFSLDLWIEFSNFNEGQDIFDSRNENGAGIFIRTGKNGSIEITISDKATASTWVSDEGVFSNGLHHLGVIIDGGPKLILLMCNGVLNDGSGKRQYGFGRFNPWLYNISGAEEAKLGGANVKIKSVRVYSKALMITEMIGNYRYGL